MAMQTLRLRRFLTSLCTLHRSLSALPTTPSPLHQPAPTYFPTLPLRQTPVPSPLSQSSMRCFSQGRTYKLYKEGDEITEDTILFEGCDYNHWLITVDFPKDSKPSSEEMVATYERICAEGLNISIEEAKKRIYACSTTTYEGFQAVMSEAESEKFKDIKGVVFVLPDSYIDPVNKEYGGDKYENGVITPRPPPYYPQTRRERKPRYYQPRGLHYDPQQQNAQYNQQRPMQGDDRNVGPPYNLSNPHYPPQQQNTQYNQQSPMLGDDRNVGPPHNLSNPHYPPQRQNAQYNRQSPMQGDDRNVGPPHLSNLHYPPQRQNAQYNRQSPMLGDDRNVGPPHNLSNPGFPGGRDHGIPRSWQPGAYPPQGGYVPPGGWDTNQLNRGGPAPSYQNNYNQGLQGNYHPQEQRGIQQEDRGNYGPVGQTGYTRDNGNYSPSYGSSDGQGANAGCRQVNQGKGQSFPQMEQQNMQQDRDAPTGQAGVNQRRC